jgi:hypothetical protein
VCVLLQLQLTVLQTDTYMAAQKHCWSTMRRLHNHPAAAACLGVIATAATVEHMQCTMQWSVGLPSPTRQLQPRQMEAPCCAQSAGDMPACCNSYGSQTGKHMWGVAQHAECGIGMAMCLLSTCMGAWHSS